MFVTSKINQIWHSLKKLKREDIISSEKFAELFAKNLGTCKWEPHPLYSVFTQYDQEYYLRQKEAFLHKYRCFYAVSKTISPKVILEMGTSAGSSADAYVSGAPGASYIGFDSFGIGTRHDDGSAWDPYEIAQKLFQVRGFKNYKLIRCDLRTLDSLPYKADFVVVDASHDFENEYADLKLALTAEPTFIFVDDANDEDAAKPAIEKFLNEYSSKIVFTATIEYQGGGILIKLEKIISAFRHKWWTF